MEWGIRATAFDQKAELTSELPQGHFGGANSRVVETWINSTKQIKVQQPIVHGT